MSGTPPTIYLAHAGPALRLWLLFRRACLAALEDNSFGIAKGVAYSALLAFFPVLTTLATLLLRANASAVSQELGKLLFEVVPPGSETVVQRHFVASGAKTVLFLAGGTIFTLWTASGAMMSLMEGFQAAYRIPVKRSFLRQRAMSFLLVVTTAVPLVIASGLILFTAHVQGVLLAQLGWLPEHAELQGPISLAGRWIEYLLAMAAIVLVSACLYFWGPNRKQSMRGVLPGAVLATVLWLLATLGFGLYMRHFSHYGVLYGSISVAIALLVWMYMLGIIALIGCEFNVAVERMVRRAA